VRQETDKKFTNDWVLGIGFADAQRIGHTVNVVEKGSDERDLQNANVVEADGAEAVEVFRGVLIGRRGQAHGEIKHGAILIGQVGLGVVPPQRGGELVVETGPAKELDMTLRSVKALILHGHYRGDHLVLAAREG
jgi:hypothetical protein